MHICKKKIHDSRLNSDSDPPKPANPDPSIKDEDNQLNARLETPLRPRALRPGRPSLALAPLRSSGASTSALAVALGRAGTQEGLRVQACGKVSGKVSRKVGK